MPQHLTYRKDKRIRTSAEYKTIYEHGIKAAGASVNFYIHRSGRQAFGVVISKRIRGAVKRNRYKRIIREYFRKEQQRFLPGTQIVVVVVREVKKASLKWFEKEFATIKQIRPYLKQNDYIIDKN
jgi:ribonuclease P protein component